MYGYKSLLYGTEIIFDFVIVGCWCVWLLFLTLSGAQGKPINLCSLVLSYVQLKLLRSLNLHLKASLSLSSLSTLCCLKYFVLIIFLPYGSPFPSNNIFHFYEKQLCFFLHNSNLSLCLLAHPLPPMLDFSYWCKL